MAKLYFYYGTMGSMKSAKAIITRYNYEENGMRAFCITSQLDTRYGEGRLSSRIANLSCPAATINSSTNIIALFEAEHFKQSLEVLICDEVQFYTPEQIHQLAQIVDLFNVDVLCYGLRTDFQLNLFSGSAALMAVADVIREEVAMCSCGRKATINARILDNKVVKTGAQIQVGGNESYKPMCRKCWRVS